MDARKTTNRATSGSRASSSRRLKASGQRARDLVDELARKLLSHMIIEQTLFYSSRARRSSPSESYEEHAIARRGLEVLLGVETVLDETFSAKYEGAQRAHPSPR